VKRRLGFLGVLVILLGVNLSAGVFVFALAGGTGPQTLLEVLFWGGQVLNFVGFGIVLYVVISKWVKGRSKTGSPD
jgi:membrane protein implicated in regulation of membrane protease activity